MDELCCECRFWARLTEGGTEQSYGRCSLTDEGVDGMAWIRSFPLLHASLITEGDFGCNQWKQREATA